MRWGAATIGAVLFVIALVCIKRKSLPRGRAWMMLIAGACLSGMLGGAIGWLAGTVGAIGSGLTQIAFGVGVPAVLTFAVGAFLYFDMVKKGASPKKWTPWAALTFFPLVATTVGGVAATLPDRVNGLVAQGGAIAQQAISALISQF